jgi:hypothetical protein
MSFGVRLVFEQHDFDFDEHAETLDLIEVNSGLPE